MRRAKITLEVEIEIDEDDSFWADCDLSLYSIAQGPVGIIMHEDIFEEAVEVISVKNTKVEYIES